MKFAAKFLRSVSNAGDYPHWERAEVALAGRSNVGKSSLLNALAEGRGLARTSKIPGRTRALNFFGVGGDLALVDLPGYGFARMNHKEAARVSLLLEDYLKHRNGLRALILLVDARRGPEQEEFAVLDLPAAREPCLGKPLATIVVATKSDKVRPGQRKAALNRFVSCGIEPIICSAVSGEGIETLRRRIVAIAGI